MILKEEVLLSYKVDHRLDCKGLSCPMPVVQTKKMMEQLKPGEVLEVEATDKGSVADLQSWSERMGHQYLGTHEENGVIHHFLRKASMEEIQEEKKFPYVVDLRQLGERWQDKDLQLIDVREPMEYAFAHIPSARLIPLGELEERLVELDPDKETWVICRSGNRSDWACRILSEKGFKQVRNVVPGMNEWTGPVEKSE